jgi:hypothetical protein
MKNFLKLCGFAVKLSKATITPAHLPFQVTTSLPYVCVPVKEMLIIFFRG